MTRVLLFFTLAGYVISVKSAGHRGDQVMLTSVLHEFEGAASVTVHFLVEESTPGTGGSLSVYLLSKQRVPTRLPFVEWLFPSLDGDWKQGCATIPRGTYQVMFVATVGLPYQSDIYLDRIELGLQYRCGRLFVRPTGNCTCFAAVVRLKYCIRNFISSC